MNRIISTTALVAMAMAGPAIAQQQQAAGSAGGEAAGNIFAQVPSDSQLQLGSDLIGSTIYSTMGATQEDGASTMGATQEGGAAPEDMASSGGATDTSATEDAAMPENTATGSATVAEPGENERQDIGQVNDIVVTQDGQIDYIIVGVGGFLGIGERSVAVNMDAVRFVQDPENPGQYLMTISATRSAMENAPEFDPSTLQGEAGDGAAMGTQPDAGQQAAQDAGQAAQDAGQATGNAVENVGQEAGQAAGQAGNAVEQAGDEAVTDN